MALWSSGMILALGARGPAIALFLFSISSFIKMHYVDIKLKLFDDDDDISEETEEDIANVKKFRVIPRSNSDE